MMVYNSSSARAHLVYCYEGPDDDRRRARGGAGSGGGLGRGARPGGARGRRVVISTKEAAGKQRNINMSQRGIQRRRRGHHRLCA